MCGICGWFDPAGLLRDRPRLERMVGTLRHRGPDETGLWLEEGAGLAIARLAVMDPQSGHQPYRNEDDSLVAVFNGEIYNFAELSRWLRSRGHHLRSRADGEVLVHLYEELGEDFLSRLNGMFALALFDRRRRRLLLARDRLGIKPLYTAVRQDRVFFASECKALLASGEVTAALDPVALEQYLTYEYVPEPRSMFRDVGKLPAGTLLVGGEARRYWNLSGGGRPLPSWWEAVDELQGRLDQSVRLQMVSDVPLGLFLSGGLDSSTLAALAARHSSHPLQTFSIGFEDPTFDESKYAREVARHLGAAHHHEVLEAKQVPDLLAAIGEVLDEPLADAAVLPTLWLARLARRGITVALAGEGADELFGGYPTYQAHRLAALLAPLPRPALDLLRAAAAALPVSHRYLSLDFKLKRFLRDLEEPGPRRHQLWMGSFSPRECADLLTRPCSEAAWQPLAALARSSTSYLEQDLQLYLRDDLLVKLDRATMAVSLEGRVPYLDHTLVEWVHALPCDWKVGKRLLKAVALRMLPPSIVHRRKKGFGLPLGQWLQSSLLELTRHSLDVLEQSGLFHARSLQGLLVEHRALRADRRKELWTLIMLAQWLERWRPTL